MLRSVHNLHLQSVAPCYSGQRIRSRQSFPARASEVVVRDGVVAQVSNKSNTVPVTFLGAEGQAVTVQCRQDEYILDAGLEAGLELPYTCRGGICGACVGRVTKGEVDQSDVDDISFTLTEEEVQQGMTLICMARPLTACEIETQSDWGYSLGVAEWKGPTGKIKGGKVEPLMGAKWDDIAKKQ